MFPRYTFSAREASAPNVPLADEHGLSRADVEPGIVSSVRLARASCSRLLGRHHLGEDRHHLFASELCGALLETVEGRFGEAHRQIAEVDGAG